MIKLIKTALLVCISSAFAHHENIESNFTDKYNHAQTSIHISNVVHTAI